VTTKTTVCHVYTSSCCRSELQGVVIIPSFRLHKNVLVYRWKHNRSILNIRYEPASYGLAFHSHPVTRYLFCQANLSLSFVIRLMYIFYFFFFDAATTWWIKMYILRYSTIVDALYFTTVLSFHLFLFFYFWTTNIRIRWAPSSSAESV